METAIVGLVGVLLGAILATAKDWWLQRLQLQKAAAYLCVRTSAALERFAERCADVAVDDGLCEGQTDEYGCHEIQIAAPTFDPDGLEVEWRSLPVALMYEVLDFPSKVSAGSHQVLAAFESSGPPDYWEGFEARQETYAKLGLDAYALSAKLRSHARLPAFDASLKDWDPIAFLRGRLSDIAAQRTRREQQISLRNQRDDL